MTVHQRPPEQLAKEIWFYSLPRRAQSTVLRRVSIALAAIAVVLLLVSMWQLALAAFAAALTLEIAGRLRGARQKKSILAQLQGGANPQLVDAVVGGVGNRSLILIALAVAAAAAFLTIGLLS